MLGISDRFSALLYLKIAASKGGNYDESELGNLELDSHADSPVLGSQSVIVRKTGRTVSVKGFTDELGRPLVVPVVDGIILHECEFTSQSFLLVIRNALHLPSMKNHLIPPFMMRLADLVVDECPKYLAQKPSLNNHTLYFENDDIRIPLSLRGIISYLPNQVPAGEQ